MAARIVHAFSDENKGSKGGVAGDQTGREIFEQDWYEREGGWDVVLVPTDREMAQAAAATAIEIADDDSFGYDQDQRTTAVSAIRKAGSIAGAEDSELDCSSLVFLAYMLNGLEVEMGYTKNLESRFMATGLFIAHREDAYTKSADLAPVGSLYLTAGKHTAIVVKSDAEPNDIEPNPEDEADEIEPPYVKVIGSVNVRIAPEKPNVTSDMSAEEAKAEISAHKVIKTAHDGDCFKLIGTDAASGWYNIKMENGSGYISNKPKYTKLVTE